MGLFYWGEANNPRRRTAVSSRPSAHELAHARAGRGEGLVARWWRDRDGTRRVAHVVPSGRDGARRAAIVQAAGYLTADDGGFADRAGDRAYARLLAKEAGVSLGEIERAARKYVR